VIEVYICAEKCWTTRYTSRNADTLLVFKKELASKKVDASASSKKEAVVTSSKLAMQCDWKSSALVSQSKYFKEKDCHSIDRSKIVAPSARVRIK
jgi:hypothetical protein